ncbi:hypothetical protein [Arthrobacter sp. 2MCAF14]|uniref:hypothetical protein n=1 Tax=Arthrobacter sp. 2MCAF14 TaxID=3232982 RepID=UPI003F93370C
MTLALTFTSGAATILQSIYLTELFPAPMPAPEMVGDGDQQDGRGGWHLPHI